MTIRTIEYLLNRFGSGKSPRSADYVDLIDTLADDRNAVYFSATAPADTSANPLWFNTTTSVLSIYHNGSWISGSGGEAGPQGPQGIQGETGPQGPQGEPGASGSELGNISVSSNITLSNNNRYFVDTSAVRTLTLPAYPEINDEIQIIDSIGTSSQYNITIARNGNKINGQTDNLVIDTNGGWYTLVYTGATYGWKVG